MPIDNTFANRLASNIKKELTLNLKTTVEEIKALNINLLYLKGKIKSAVSELYLEDYIKLILNTDDKRINIDVEKSIEFRNLVSQNRITIYRCNDSTLKAVYKSYVMAFCEQIVRKNELVEDYKFFSEVKYYTFDNILHIIRRYYFNLQKHILLGRSYRFPVVNFTMKIFGRTEFGEAYKNRIDWGKSIKNLVELAKTHDPELYSLYYNKKIGRNRFIELMAKHGLKWFVYNDKDFNLWLVIKKTNCPNPNGKMYKVMPANGVTNDSRSQITFTDENPSVEAIIETSELMLMDKIRALERVDMDYCLNTFTNDRKTNK
jgi:hypothetical protein